MSRHENGRRSHKAVALRYGSNDNAPVIVASGMGYVAEKIVETAQEHGVPIYEDNSLSTMLTQLKLGQEVPEELYQAIVEIYVYFLKFDPSARDKEPGKQKALKAAREPEPQEAPEAQAVPERQEDEPAAVQEREEQ